MDMKMILWAQEMMDTEYGKIIIWLGIILMLMAIDLITGIIQACVNHDIKSGKMSIGILKKFALLMVLIAIVPLTIVLPNLISVSVIIGIYILETTNEVVSIVENLNLMGVATNIFSPIIKLLKKDEEKK